MKGKARTIVAALAVSASCLVGIAGYEKYMGQAYKDAVGVPTIGYGETRDVRMGQKTTPDRALAQLLKSTKAHADGIRKCINVPLYQHEFDALVSFAFNIGVSDFCGSTLAKRLNSSDYGNAANEMLRWDKGTIKGRKVVLNGLSIRRHCERQYFLGLSDDMMKCKSDEERRRGKQ